MHAEFPAQPSHTAGRVAPDGPGDRFRWRNLLPASKGTLEGPPRNRSSLGSFNRGPTSAQEKSSLGSRDGILIDPEPLCLVEDLFHGHEAGSQATAFVDPSEPMGQS